MIQHITPMGARPPFGPAILPPRAETGPERGRGRGQEQGQTRGGWGLAQVVVPLPSREPRLGRAADFARELCGAVPDLRRIARRFVSQDCLADDLVQLTCMRALERRDQFLLGTNLVGWLSTILRNLHRDELRRRRYQTRLETQLGDLGRPTVEPGRDETPVWSNLTAEDVRQASAGLPEEMREAYRLYTFENLSYVAIARQLQVPMATVATRLYRARIKLREILTARLGLPADQQREESLDPPCSS
jgi:RNA polymerase sigma-70 factor, ECF subfamily